MNKKLVNMAQLLNKNGFIAECFEAPQYAAARALELIGGLESAGFGGSVTVQDMGLYEALFDRGNEVHWHWKTEDRQGAQRAAAQADWYICSTNALTEDGQFVNIDGSGNRVAAIAHGPKRLLLILGANKLCGDYDDAINRIKTVACPKNAVRLGMNTPCAVTGKCNDCSSKQRFCNFIGILQRPTLGREAHVLLVDKELGY